MATPPAGQLHAHWHKWPAASAQVPGGHRRCTGFFSPCFGKILPRAQASSLGTDYETETVAKKTIGAAPQGPCLGPLPASVSLWRLRGPPGTFVSPPPEPPCYIPEGPGFRGSPEWPNAVMPVRSGARFSDAFSRPGPAAGQPVLGMP